jgi:hypothetical protein
LSDPLRFEFGDCADHLRCIKATPRRS